MASAAKVVVDSSQEPGRKLMLTLLPVSVE